MRLGTFWFPMTNGKHWSINVGRRKPLPKYPWCAKKDHLPLTTVSCSRGWNPFMLGIGSLGEDALVGTLRIWIFWVLLEEFPCSKLLVDAFDTNDLRKKKHKQTQHLLVTSYQLPTTSWIFSPGTGTGRGSRTPLSSEHDNAWSVGCWKSMSSRPLEMQF